MTYCGEESEVFRLPDCAKCEASGVERLKRVRYQGQLWSDFHCDGLYSLWILEHGCRIA